MVNHGKTCLLLVRGSGLPRPALGRAAHDLGGTRHPRDARPDDNLLGDTDYPGHTTSDHRARTAGCGTRARRTSSRGGRDDNPRISQRLLPELRRSSRCGRRYDAANVEPKVGRRGHAADADGAGGGQPEQRAELVCRAASELRRGQP
ncbi:hypothetical protein [Nocardia sp. NBC_00403]|uniref:hypothetical protein n=1 Tax=Nocardia sp. NBC_00403 TaxID=2975990 RepID=UPI002E1F0BB0